MKTRIKIPLPWKAKAWSPVKDTMDYGWRALYIHINTNNGFFYCAAGYGFKSEL